MSVWHNLESAVNKMSVRAFLDEVPLGMSGRDHPDYTNRGRKPPAFPREAGDPQL